MLCCQCKKQLIIEYLLKTAIEVHEIQLRARCPYCKTIQIFLDVCDKTENLEDAKKFEEEVKDQLYVG